MHDLSNIGPRIIMSFGDGSVYITETVFFAMIVAAVLIILALFSTRKMEKYPKGPQVIAEFLVEFAYKFVGETMGKHNQNFAPYIGTLFSFLALGSALGLFGFRPMTADVNAAFAMSSITFILIQYNSIRTRGIKGYLGHMADPSPFLFPIKLIEEISFPVSLGFRLFGNILGGAIVMALIMTALGGLSHMLHLPIPIFEAIIPLPFNLFFDVFEPLLQSFIFTMLTMVFISKAMAAPGEHH